MSTPPRLASAVLKLRTRLLPAGVPLFGGSGAPAPGLQAAPTATSTRQCFATWSSARRHVALLAVLVGGFVFVFGVGSAQALLVHTGSFGGPGSGGGEFNSPQAVAVDEATGDVYVVDSGNFRVEKFDSSGNFLLAFGQDVDATTGGNVCPSADTCQQGTQATGPGTPPGFNDPLFVAVDNSGGPSAGDVYVGDRGDDTITKFDSSGNLVTSWATGGQLDGASSFGSIDGITVDNSGNLLVINDSNPVFEFTQDGSPITNFSTGSRGMGALGMDVDASGNIFKVNGDSSIEEITSTGGDTGQVTAGGSTGLVVDRSSGDLYQDTGTGVSHYVFNSSGDVVEPGGSPCPVVPNGACPATDTFGSGALTAGTGMGFNSSMTVLYVADAGTNTVAMFGPPSPGAPVIDSESATNIGSRSATINAEVNPFGVDTTCTFQYVDDTDFQSTGFTGANVKTAACAPADLGSTFSDQAASANLTGLTLNTTYDFRVIATNSDGTTDGTAAQFTTLGPVSIDSESASNIGSTTAELDTEINPLGTDTSCEFQYVNDTTFQSSGFTSGAVVTVPCSPQDLGAGVGDVSALADISGLKPNTTYDFRAVASNTLGTEDGTPTQFTTAPPASIDSESASNVGAQSAELDTLINPEGIDTSCKFQYVDDSDFQSSGFTGTTVKSTPCTPQDLGSGIGDVSALADIKGLTANTTYDFRAVAHNSLGTADGTAAQFTTTPPVSVDSESVTTITATSATLHAQINPNGLTTHYQFQYVTDADFQSSGYADATTVPHTPVDVGNGTSDQPATVDLTGLTPSTKYHFRVVGSNAAGSISGADRTFTTLGSIPAAGLPDNRAYELVSPAAKDGEVEQNLVIGGEQAAADGNSVGYVSLAPFPDGVGPSINDLATRGPNGWSSKPILPQQAPGVTLELPGYLLFSSDLSKAILSNGGATIGGTDGQDDPALVPGSCTTPLFPTPPALPTTPCTGEVTGFPNLFVRDNTDGSFQLVNSYAQAPSGVTPVAATEDGGSADLSTVVFDEPAQLTADASASSDNLYMWTGGTVKLLGAGATLGGSGRVLHAVSADGSRIFFTDSSGNLNVFQNGSATQVDKTQGGSGAGGGGQFMTAASDGSVVFFTDGDSAGLTGDTVSGSGTNLYEYKVGSAGSGTLTDLTGNDNLAQVDGVLGASSDGSYIYFVAEGVLATGATSGAENLYVDHNGTTTFIATLSGSDGSDWNSQLTSRVTPDGTHLAFNSVQSLTGFDNTDANTGGADTEIFIYGATAKTLTCASCNPTGNPIGSSQLDSIEGGLLGGGNQYLQHNLSDDGSRLFFDSSDDLSPRDTNGVQDVYEYENGHDYLISTGTSTNISLFLDASANGNDVFFVTRDQLVPQDTDGLDDLYDARVNGGFPAPSPVPPCTGDSCRPATTPPPPAPTIATVTFSGPSNPTPGSPPKKKKKAKIRVSTRAVTGFRFAIDVRTPAAGKLTVSGAGVKTIRRAVKGGHTYRLIIRLTATERATLQSRHKGRLRVVVHVLYRPATGGSSTVTVPVTVKA